MHSYSGTYMCFSAAATVLLLLLLAPLVSTQCSADKADGDWLPYGGACYKYYNQSEFWYNAEMTCTEAGGHLVSVASDPENRLVGKLSLCRDVWIGRYASDLTRMSDPDGYAWTDESKASQYNRHNFTEKASIHRPLIRAQGLSWHNSLYHEHHPFVCKIPTPATVTGEHKQECPSTMKFYHGHCYLLSSFEANFVEASFFCQNRSTQLTSVLHEGELRFLNTLDLGADECQLKAMWLGLVKLNPCYPDRGGKELCYQWTDFSGKHTRFPSWAEGQPQAATTTTTASEASESAASADRDKSSCVAISGDGLFGADCNDRRRFVCKAPAGSLSGDVWKALDQPAAGPMTGGSNDTSGGGAALVEVAEAAEKAQTIAPATATNSTTTDTIAELGAPTQAPTNATEDTAAAAAQSTVGSRAEAKGELEKAPADSDSSRSRRRKEPVLGRSDNTDPEDRFSWDWDRFLSNLESGEQAKKRQKRQKLPAPVPTAETAISEQSPQAATEPAEPSTAAPATAEPSTAAPTPTEGDGTPPTEKPFIPHDLETESFLSQ